MSAPTAVVAGWLNIATKGLSLAARERISLEINAHFEEARDRHRAEGLDEAQALVEALRELGDADAAARRFRREYLTKDDFTLIRTELHSGVSLTRGVAVSVGILIMSFLIFVPPGVRAECLIAAMLCFGLTLAPWLLTIRRKPGSSLSAVLFISILMDCTLVGAAYVIMRDVGSVAVLLLFSLVMVVPRFRLLLKLRKVRDVWRGDASSRAELIL